MGVELYAFTCGFLTIPHSFMFDGEEGPITVPIPSYPVVHPKERILFDTGLHIATLDNPVDHIGERWASYQALRKQPRWRRQAGAKK